MRLFYPYSRYLYLVFILGYLTEYQKWCPFFSLFAPNILVLNNVLQYIWTALKIIVHLVLNHISKVVVIKTSVIIALSDLCILVLYNYMFDLCYYSTNNTPERICQRSVNETFHSVHFAYFSSMEILSVSVTLTFFRNKRVGECKH